MHPAETVLHCCVHALVQVGYRTWYPWASEALQEKYRWVGALLEQSSDKRVGRRQSNEAREPDASLCSHCFIFALPCAWSLMLH
jgi:hypothetical protein